MQSTIITNILRIIAFVVVIAGVGFLVFQPGLLNTTDINSQVAQLSPKAEVALVEFNRCFSQMVASIGHGGESECKQQAMVLLQKSDGAQYAAEAMRAIDAYLEQVRQGS